MRASLWSGLASLGAAAPYAIAAKYTQPDRPVIALVGDGAMQMKNMAELITVAKYWRDWLDHRWIACVLNNEYLNQVTWEQLIINRRSKIRGVPENLQRFVLALCRDDRSPRHLSRRTRDA
jgi:pyruvate dehydrogenase (quinone)